MKLRILFLGDSVTDSHHSTHNDPYGCGYVSMIYNHLNCTQPLEELTIINSGFNGHRSKDLLERVDGLLENQFDYVFVLIGVNDSWRKFDHNDETTLETYHANVDLLVRKIKEKSNAKLILMSPFVLKINDLTENIAIDLKPKQNAMRSIANSYHLTFVDLQKEFDFCSEKYEKTSLAKDGIHPTILGHSLIAEAVLKEIILD